MKTFATVLIKVEKGNERKVRDWLKKKRKENIAADRRCLEPSCEHFKQNGMEGEFTCDKLEILALALIGGSYDLALVAAVPDILVVENFIIDCLRNGEIGVHILDTHSLYGTLVDLE